MGYSFRGRRTGNARQAPRLSQFISVLHNPFYAGAYAYGKSTHCTTLVEGRLSKTYGHDRPMAAWSVLLRDHHAGYNTWADFERNQERLRRNAFGKPAGGAKAGRGGRALLAGLLRCRRCGRLLSVVYNSRGRVARYLCRAGHAMHGLAPCLGVGARRPDELVAAEIQAIVEPLAVDAALAAMDLAEQQITERRRALELECEQARAPCSLPSDGAYESVDPDNSAGRPNSKFGGMPHSPTCGSARRAWPNGSRSGAPAGPRSLAAPGERPARGPGRLPTADARVKQQLVRTLVEEIVVDVDDATRGSSS